MDMTIPQRKAKLDPAKFDDCKVTALHCLSRSLEKMLSDEWDRIIAAMCAVGEQDDTFPIAVTVNLTPRAESIQTGCSLKYKAAREASGDFAVVRYDGTEVRKTEEPDLFDGTHADVEALVEEAKALFERTMRVSITLLQRHLKVSPDTAFAIMDRLEDEGFVTGPDAEGNRRLVCLAGEG